jgi:hypothetical protein
MVLWRRCEYWHEYNTEHKENDNFPHDAIYSYATILLPQICWSQIYMDTYWLSKKLVLVCCGEIVLLKSKRSCQ